MEQEFENQRKKLVEDYIRPKVSSPKILDAFLKVPRHKFVPKIIQEKAYLDTALSIGEGQTISQPSLVASMTDHLNLKSRDKVLEVGTGSGYQAAILAELVKEVFTVEIIEPLYKRAKKLLEELGYANIHCVLANGSIGYKKDAPYNAIIVTAGAPYIPQPLIDQLADGGRMIIPVGESLGSQELILVKKEKGKVSEDKIGGVFFVPLTGEYGIK